MTCYFLFLYYILLSLWTILDLSSPLFRPELHYPFQIFFVTGLNRGHPFFFSHVRLSPSLCFFVPSPFYSFLTQTWLLEGGLCTHSPRFYVAQVFFVRPRCVCRGGSRGFGRTPLFAVRVCTFVVSVVLTYTDPCRANPLLRRLRTPLRPITLQRTT